MPKIVENVKERILLETRKQIEEFGYSKVNIRGIAAACNIGVGTIYNYFESKDVIIANFMLSDWFLCIQKIKDKIAGGENSIEMAYVYFSELTASHSYLFSDDIAYKNYKVNSNKWHIMLRNQIADLINSKDKFLNLFISEAIITWSIEGKKYEELKPFFESLINKYEECNYE